MLLKHPRNRNFFLKKKKLNRSEKYKGIERKGNKTQVLEEVNTLIAEWFHWVKKM